MTGQPAAPDEVIANAIVQLLMEYGPASEEDLLDALEADGIELGPDPEETLLAVLDDNCPTVVTLGDGRQAHLPTLMIALVFTHRLTATEIEYDLLTVSPDLEPISMLFADPPYDALVGGGPVLEVLADFHADELAERGIPVEAVDDTALLLPGGRLRQLGLAAGDLVGVRVAAAGIELVHVRGDEAKGAVPSDLSARLVDTVDEYATEGPESLDRIVWALCAADEELFCHPLPPLTDLLDAAGLPYEGEYVAPAGFDFAVWGMARRVGSMQSMYHISSDEALAALSVLVLFAKVAALVGVAAEQLPDVPMPEVIAAARPQVAAELKPFFHGAGSADVHAESVQAALGFLAEPGVALAVLGETIGTEADEAHVLALFAEILEPLVSRPTRPALRWLRGKALQRMGDINAAEASFQRAESLDPTWGLALLELARYASDRGDADRGLALLRRAGVPEDDSLFELLQRYRVTARTDIGRNQPCWCGSGRKYKQCHLRREELPLSRRAAWLYRKGEMHLVDGPWQTELLLVTQARAQHWDDVEGLLRAARDPLVADAVMFEGGVFANFLVERGRLLPEDERLLGEQWLLIDRSIFEVEAVRVGEGFTVRDLRTGDHLDVTERAASRQVKAGMLICARIVPAGDSNQAFGGIEPIEMYQRDGLIALLDASPDPVELVAFLSSRFAPPRLQNTEGDEMVIRETTIQVADPAALAASLDSEYDREDDDGDSQVWIEHVTTHGMLRIRALLRLTGDELRIETNSEARQDRVLATLESWMGELTIIEDVRRPGDEITKAITAAGRPGPSDSSPVGDTGLDPDDPEVAAFLDQMGRQFEAAWLEDSIPALAGLTPRQAAADPTRRPDLIRLLDSFPRGQGPAGMMDVDRLRVALELD